MPDIISQLHQRSDFSRFLKLLRQVDLVTILQNYGPWTIFAPSDAAFDRLPPGSVDGWRHDVARLNDILMYHIVEGELLWEDLTEMSEVITIEGDTVAIDTHDGLAISGAKVTEADIEADNGVIHVIDHVIMPAHVAD
ncbi:MAG: fasciclin domain-containing protein [Phycisphaerae bacterium]|nr:fasciclin domain-containing protein [Phycisphaerae bacterium]